MECKSLRDVATELEALNANVYAISLDEVQALAKFAKKQSLGYRLLSDPDGSAARKYGALGKRGRWASRMTFIVDDQGILRYAFEKVGVRSHGADVVAQITALKKSG